MEKKRDLIEYWAKSSKLDLEAAKVYENYSGDVRVANREIVNIVKRYIEKLREKNISFHKIILFGSSATDNDREDSDIDIAVISEDFGQDRFEVRVKLTKIAFEVDARLEPHPINLKEFAEETWKTLIHEIRRKGVEIAA